MKFLILIGTGILNMLAGGFVLSWLWRWFVADRFGLRGISYGEAIGLLYVVGVFFLPMGVSNAVNTEKDSDERFVAGLTSSLTLLFIAYPMMLLFGFLWHKVLF